MIEGIVGIFVILFLILVVPYIKDAWVKYKQPDQTVTTLISYSNDQYVYAPGSDVPPLSPVYGQTWMNTQNNIAYVWDGKVWSPYHTPKEGDVWFW